MLWVLRRQLGGFASDPVLRSLTKSLIAAILTGFAAFGAAQLAAGWTTSQTIARLGPVAIGGLAGIAAYTICVFALNITETRDLPRLFARR